MHRPPVGAMERKGSHKDMCGIIAVLRRPSDRKVPTAEGITAPLVGAVDLLARVEPDLLGEAADLLGEADRLLGGVPGLLALDRDPTLVGRINEVLAPVPAHLAGLEAAVAGSPDVEEANAALVRVRDVLWTVSRDRLGAFTGVTSLRQERPVPSDAGLAVLLSAQQALSALDRLEVRGRDSAGLQITVWNHGIDQHDPEVVARSADPLHRSGSVRLLDGGGLAFVVKASAEIGELGDNTAVLRSALVADRLLARALAAPAVQGSLLGHTRWASVGLISEPNAHPVDSTRADGETVPLVTVVQNGDVDNHADLAASEGLSLAPEITTDAKVVPALCAAHLAAGRERLEAFRRTVNAFEGSVAIGMATGDAPDRLLLSLRGSGQGLFVGLAEDTFVVASEPYGVVELTADYLRMDGETPADLDDPGASRGQIVELDAASAGSVDGITRRSYDGRNLPVTSADLSRAEVTTRDIDRGDHPHFLIKEISESPDSVRSTLRGRLVADGDGTLGVRLGSEVLCDDLRAELAA
ncbi:MAG: glucosamine-6-phosphate synthase, partial [Actinomycetota bacterium]|nr:glucosamine-6-phosphate synthase [Actinomycetota bacterium]